ncbi:MAG: hypothetical protein ACLQBY_18335 [Solirubrobacteraceae bacterium]
MPETLEDIGQLAKSILHRKRDFWIVVLTARRLEAMPAVPPMVVREIVGANVPIIFLKSHLATHLSTLLPPKTHVYGGALRVYRPGVTDDPWGHPLLYDPSGEYGEEILDWLGRIFTPSVARPPKLAPEQRLVVLEYEVKRITQARARELRVLRARYEAWVLGEPNGEKSTGLRPLLPWRSKRQDSKLADEMRRLIVAQWASYLPAHEQTRHPLRDYRMTSEFLNDVRTRFGGVPTDRVAWVCSLVICRLDVRLAGLAAGPLRPSSDAPQLTREDGARGWWCNLDRSPTTRSPRVVYWSCPDGTIDLRALGYPPKDAS